MVWFEDDVMVKWYVTHLAFNTNYLFFGTASGDGSSSALLLII